MYKKEQGASGAPGDNWHGPLRNLGQDEKTLWGLHEGVPVAVATNKVRSANVSEILAHTILRRGNLAEPVRMADPSAQQTLIDLRRDPPAQREPACVPLPNFTKIRVRRGEFAMFVRTGQDHISGKLPGSAPAGPARRDQ